MKIPSLALALTALLLAGCAHHEPQPITVSAAPLRTGVTGILYTRPNDPILSNGQNPITNQDALPTMSPAEDALPTTTNPDKRAIYLPAQAGQYLTQGGSRDLQALPGQPFDALAPSQNDSSNQVGPDSAEYMPNHPLEAPLQFKNPRTERPLVIYRNNIEYTGWARELGVQDPLAYDEASKLVNRGNNETPIYIKQIGWVAWSPDREKSLVLPPALKNSDDQ